MTEQAQAQAQQTTRSKKEEKPTTMINIIGYGEMKLSKNQIKLDTISIMGDLKFESLYERKFKLYSEKECDIFFEKQTKILSLKEEKLPVLTLDKVLSKIYWEDQKMWENSFFQKIEKEKTHVVGAIIDDTNKKCFITFFISDLHKKRIVIRSEQNMVDYIFPDNYIVLLNGFEPIQQSVLNFLRKN